jgi:hypothetical protein
MVAVACSIYILAATVDVSRPAPASRAKADALLI